jgi:undecaprenol kinase
VILALVRPPVLWIALSVLAAGVVLALELVNTALERVIDHLHPEHHAAIKAAKDCAAGAVLIASLVAAIIGAMTVSIALGWLH